MAFVGVLALHFLEDVRVVNMVFNGICDGVVPGHIVKLKVRLSLLSLTLLIDLTHNVASEGLLSHFVPLNFLLVLHQLVVFELVKCQVFLLPAHLNLVLLVLLELHLSVQSLIGDHDLIFFPFQVLIVSLEKGLAAIIVPLDVILELICPLLIVVYISLAIFAELGSRHVGGIHHGWSLSLHPHFVHHFVFLVNVSELALLLLVEQNGLGQFIIVHVFVCVHVVLTGVFVNLNLVDNLLVNLRPQDLLVVLG